jgi:hypothetical protein
MLAREGVQHTVGVLTALDAALHGHGRFATGQGLAAQKSSK